MQQSRSREGRRRRGAAVAELAIVLPLLAFLFLIAVDYCRIFYYSQIVANCARNGALYEGDAYAASRSLYADYDAAARADAPSPMNTELKVSKTTGSDG